MKILKFIILPILHFIRRVLTMLKKHCTPHYIAAEIPGSAELYRNEQMLNCYNHFKKYFKNSIFLTTKKIREYAIITSLQNDNDQKKIYLEFGVYVGTTINIFANFIKKTTIYGFDSFEGLKEDWHGNDIASGEFDLKNKLPKVKKNVSLIVGWVQDTLDDFLNKHKPSINFVHLDMDTYKTTKFVLNKIKPYLIKNCIILFDELYNFPGWDVGEYKALTETFNESEYKFVAFSSDGRQAVIKIIK